MPRRGSAPTAPAPADRRPCSMPNAACAATTDGAGVPGADHRRRLAVAHQFGGDANRRPRLAAQRRGRRLRHRRRRRARRPPGRRATPASACRASSASMASGRPTRVDRHARVPRGGQRPVHDRRRRVVAAHGVDGDAHPAAGGDRSRRGAPRRAPSSREEASGLLLVDGANLSLVVEAAVRADAVRRLRLAALRAGPGGGGRQRVVGAALAAAGLGVSSFWIRHRRWSAEKRAPSGRPAGDRPSGARSCSARRSGWCRRSRTAPGSRRRQSGFIGSAR